MILHDRWTWGAGHVARRCPVCGCHPGRSCRMALPFGGEGYCVPAGAYGRTRCSACDELGEPDPGLGQAVSAPPEELRSFLKSL